MTTTVTASSVGPLTANGTTPIPFSFQSLSATEIEVVRNGVPVASNSYTVLRSADGTGTITPTTSWGSDQVTIRSKPNYLQTTSFSRFGTFYPDMLNGPLDRLMRTIIAVRDRATSGVGENTEAAQAAAAAAAGSAITATNAATSAAASSTAAAAARVAAEAAAAAAQAGGGNTATTVATKAALIALTPPAYGSTIVLSEAGSEGAFVFLSVAAYNTRTGRTLTADVATDVTQGIIVAPSSGVTGASGAWVRLSYLAGEPLYVDWFLVTPGAFSTTAAVQSLEDLRFEGQAVQFGRKTYMLSNIKVRKGGHWRGVGKTTVIQDNGGGNTNTFLAATDKGLRFSHMRLTGLYDVDNSGACFPLLVHSFRASDGGGPVNISDLEFDHLWFDNCDTGIRVMYWGVGPVNDVPGTTWYTPVRSHIHDCVFDDVLYQCIIPESHDITIERCFFKLSAKPSGGYRPFGHCIRVLGCNRLDIRQNRFEVPDDYQAIAVMPAGTDNGLSNVAYRVARNVTIESNRFIGGYIKVEHSADRLRIVANNMWNNPTSTTADIICLFIGSSPFPPYFGVLELTDNYAVGYTRPLWLENTALHQLSVKRNTFIGNKKTGGAFDIAPIKLQINSGGKLQDTTTDMRMPVLAEFEDNNIFCNPTTTGAYISMVGDMTGLNLSYTGNKVSERAYNINHINHGFPSGTTPQISIARTGAWQPFDTATGLQADIAGDNRAMPAGHYVAMMASHLFRPEQVVGPFPASYA